jgi:hypothetical protein
MKLLQSFYALVFILVAQYNGPIYAQNNLKIVFIRHGEKPKDGDNLSCKGLNRAMLLPKVLYEKIGVPDYTYVPVLEMKKGTKHARMLQTIVPFAVKYNLKINSHFANKDTLEIANDIKQKQGTVLVVWEHHALSGIVHALGLNDLGLLWDDNDYDSMWIVEFKNGQPYLAKDKEGLEPKDDCMF